VLTNAFKRVIGTRLAALLPAAFLLIPLVAAAQVPTNSNAAAMGGQPDSAPVIVNGEVQFLVAGVTSFPAKVRAKRLADRIVALAKNTSFDPDNLRVENRGDKHEILAPHEKQPIITLVDADAQLENVDRDVLARVVTDATVAAIKKYRYERRPDIVLQHALSALIRTAVLVALVVAVFWGFKQLNRRLEVRFQRRLAKLESKSKRLLRSEQIWALIHTGLRLLQVLIVLALIYVFLNFVLSLFPQTRYLASRLFALATEPVRAIGEAIINFIPSLIFLLVLVFISRYLLKLTRAFFSAIVRRQIEVKGFERDWAWPTYRIVKLVIIILSLIFAYPYIPGSDSDAFKGVSLLLGVLLSLGSTSITSNVIAGYSLTYRRAFRIGDLVKIAGAVGWIKETGVLVTRMRSIKNEEVVIPNSTILNSEVVNYSSYAQEDGLILHTVVGIGYEVPWRQVKAMLLLAAQRTPGILEEPQPFVLQKALSDFCVNYELNAYCDDANTMARLYNDLHENIQDVFNEYGVQIMTPAYESDTPEPKIVPKERWFESPATRPKSS
jgi:small-conductance mechanosensitive channel